MKKLLISVAALMFATLLFTQDDSDNSDTEITHNGVASSEMSITAKSKNL